MPRQAERIEPDLSRLPRVDGFGNYWFGKPGHTETPAIFATHTGRYMVSLGAKGVVFRGGELATFATAQEALAELRRRLR